MSTFSKLIRVVAFSAAVAVPVTRVLKIDAQESKPAQTFAAADFTGTWHWMFQGKAFVTMVLEQKGDQFTGSMTNGSIGMNDDGKITEAASAEGSSPITRASLENGALHIVSKQGDDVLEVVFTLTSPKTGELRFVGIGAPAKAEPILVEKLWSEPPVQP